MKRTLLFGFCLALLTIQIASARGLRTNTQQGVKECLQRAEALLDSDPSAARAVLDSLNLQSSIFNLPSKDAALYALLRTQAEYKCYITPETDSLIRIATDYYGTPRRKNFHAALAWYTLGCVYSDWHDDAAAVEAYLTAKPLFPDTLSRYYILCNQNLGIHYLNRRMYRQSLAALTACRSGAERIGDSATVAFADYHAALGHLYRQEYTQAQALLERVQANPKATALAQNTVWLQLAKIALYQHKDCTRARYYLHLNEAGEPDSTTLGANYSLRGDICCELQQPDSAYYWYRRSLACQSELFTECWNYHQLAELAPRLGLTDSVPSYVRRYTLLADSVRYVERQSEVSEAYSRQQVEESRRALTRHNVRILLIVIALALFSALLAGIGFLLRDRRRKTQYLCLQEELQQNRRESLNIPEEDQAELRRRKLDICCRMFRRTPSARLLLGRTATKNAPSFSAAERTQILSDITTSFIDIMLDVKNEVPQISEQELLLCAFNALRSPSQAIAECLILSPTTLRTRKFRLKEKLPAELFELFFEETPSNTNS
ncbi:MAG: hypothetical protein IK011_00355 [Bacteroidaceae bacterium]|nr:hypothetical protein [Bacteroidaceae bacterium]MBR4778324.1 hypothetical protein [Bacteroidaceae bacterium]